MNRRRRSPSRVYTIRTISVSCEDSTPRNCPSVRNAIVSAACPSCVELSPTQGPIGFETEAVNSSAMMRKVLLSICACAALLRAVSIASVLRRSDPNTMAAMIATSAVANNTSTRVKPRSEARGWREHIGTGLEYFLCIPLLPQNLNFDFTNRLQGCRGDDSLPSILFRPFGGITEHLVTQRWIPEVSAGFPDRIDQTHLCFHQLLLGQHRGGSDIGRTRLQVKIPVPQTKQDR